MRYQVIGPFPVRDVPPGGEVDIRPGDGINEAALLEAGHIARLSTGKTPAKRARGGKVRPLVVAEVDGPELFIPADGSDGSAA